MSKKLSCFQRIYLIWKSWKPLWKSLCAYQDQLKIYVLNEDLPTEWFYYHESALAPVGFRSDQLSDVS